MNKRWLWIGGAAVLLVVIGAIAWYLASPLFLDRTVQEELPFSAATAEETRATLPEQEQIAEITPPPSASEQTAEPEPSTGEGPASLNTANFVGADGFHQGSGTATLYQLEDGSRLLRFEDFMVTNGPQLHVLLATNPAPTSREELGEYIDLGPLKGNIGDQNYQLPTDLDLESYRSVVIYCVPFHVVFATASFIP
jgi:hypothetical protein